MITAALLICLAPIAHDGDTVRCGNSKQSVRIFGIQAPEIGMAGALNSRVALQGKSEGGLICEPRGTNYSRVVAICFNAAGEDIGKAQLQGGFAKEWCAYSVSRDYPRGYYGGC